MYTGLQRIIWLTVALVLPNLHAADNVVLISLDGVRCQEMFQGMDAAVWQAQQEGKDIATTPLYQRFWAATPEERRLRLMPFFWGTLMKDHGAIAGNRFKGSVMKLTNRHRFSYPSYSEILTGAANDDQIRSNDKVRNPRRTVLEHLRDELRLPPEQVAVFAGWDVMGWIAAREADALFTNCGFEAYDHPDPRIQSLSRLQFETPTPWDSVRHDVFTFEFALAHLQQARPRVLYLALGETDDWAHDKRYDRVLEALHRNDGQFRQLWDWLQSDEAYRGKTTLLFATDHGRGDNEFNWMHHNDKLEGARYVWLAAAGAGILKRGELVDTPELGQNQIATTLCRALSLNPADYSELAGPPVEFLFQP